MVAVPCYHLTTLVKTLAVPCYHLMMVGAGLLLYRFQTLLGKKIHIREVLMMWWCLNNPYVKTLLWLVHKIRTHVQHKRNLLVEQVLATEFQLLSQRTAHKLTHLPLVGMCNRHNPYVKTLLWLVHKIRTHVQHKRNLLVEQVLATEFQLLSQRTAHKLTHLPLVGMCNRHNPYVKTLLWLVHKIRTHVRRRHNLLVEQVLKHNLVEVLATLGFQPHKLHVSQEVFQIPCKHNL
jgi:uncharacterized protein (DUF2164 family)